MNSQPHSPGTRIAATLAAVVVTVSAAICSPSSARDADPALTPDTDSAQWVTLITGDRVAVDSNGHVVEVKHGPGRGKIPIEIQTYDGVTEVVPADASQLIAAGRLDRRLFDVTGLTEAKYRKAHPDGDTGLIVTYQGKKRNGPSALRATKGSTVTASFDSLNADAVTVEQTGAAAAWEALTTLSASGDQRVAAGVEKVWLDGVVEASLDESVPQIGAPGAWAAGYDGSGVKVAVLDTGYDATHPDLKDQVVEEKNFTNDDSVKDGHGHGTHVASTVAGTGAKANGVYKGVAPGADLMVGKVLGNDGSGDESWILSGMEWATEQGADIVSMSLGGEDTVEIDPLEEAVNTLSEGEGPLFVVAAGNSGPSPLGTIGSPGSADAALTIGAVDKKDVLADFSSTGPRYGDGAVKPDVTAPGVDIVAAQAAGTTMGTPGPEGYTSADGTSMATPHVAGAAAILAQEHPEWTGQQIKDVLTSATQPGEYSSYQQGSGRVDVARAISQSVVAESGSVNFGSQSWPHDDDVPVEKTITYRNLGDESVTLDLTIAGTSPDGSDAPEGMFSLGAPQVTVPANGTAEVTAIANTRLGGDANGAYSAHIDAQGGDQQVHTAAVVDRQIASYEVTFKPLDRTGAPAEHWKTRLWGIEGAALGVEEELTNGSESMTLRLPQGRYFATNSIYVTAADKTSDVDWLYMPMLMVDKDMTVTLDARDAKPVDITVPNRRAEPSLARATAEMAWFLPLSRDVITKSFDQIRVGHVGPDARPDEVSSEFGGIWRKTDGTEYQAAYNGNSSTRFPTGFTRHPKRKDFAEADIRMGAPGVNKIGSLMVTPHTGMGWSTGLAPHIDLPRKYTLFMSVSEGQRWDMTFQQYSETGDKEMIQEEQTRFRPGQKYSVDFNIGVFGPMLQKDAFGVSRTGDKITASLPLASDGDGHVGSTTYSSAKTRLYRNGKLLGTVPDPAANASFTVPAGKARYRLKATAEPAGPAPASTRINTVWRFRSAHTVTKTFLPVSVVRFAPRLGMDSKTRAKKKIKVPVEVQGAASGKNLKVLKVWASLDKGKTWVKHSVKKGSVKIRSPRAGRSVSLKAKVKDKDGNTVTQKIIDAYLTK